MISTIIRHILRLPHSIYQLTLPLQSPSRSLSTHSHSSPQIHIDPTHNPLAQAAILELYNQTQSEGLRLRILSHVEKYGLEHRAGSPFGWKMLITVGSPATLTYAIAQHDLLFQNNPATTPLCAKSFLARKNIWAVVSDRLKDSPEKHATIQRIIAILEGIGLDRPLPLSSRNKIPFSSNTTAATESQTILHKTHPKT